MNSVHNAINVDYFHKGSTFFSEKLLFLCIKFSCIMDNELLQRILRTNSRVVIPGFGAFLRKEQGGALIFSPFLRTDDGKLKAILELEYGVSTAEAEAMMGEFAERVRTILKVKSKYYIDGVGMLLVDNNGVVSFVEDKAPLAAPAPQPVAQTQSFVPPAPAPAPSVAPQQAVRQPLATPQPQPQPQPAPQPAPTPAPRPVAPVAPNVSPFARPAAPAPAPMPTAPRPAAPIPTPAPTAPRPTGASGQPMAGMPGAPQKGQRPSGPMRKPTKKSKKSDMWLVVAIIAAAVVIILMVLGILNSSQLPPIE